MISIMLKEWDKGSLEEFIVLLLRRRDSMKNCDVVPQKLETCKGKWVYFLFIFLNEGIWLPQT